MRLRMKETVKGKVIEELAKKRDCFCSVTDSGGRALLITREMVCFSLVTGNLFKISHITKLLLKGEC